MRWFLALWATHLHSAVEAEKVEAVLIMHDDNVHTFLKVSRALRELGIDSLRALALTQEVESTHFQAPKTTLRANH